MDNQQWPSVKDDKVCSMMCGSLDGRGVWGRYTYVYGWVPLLFTWHYHNIVNQLYSSIKFKSLKKSLWEHKHKTQKSWKELNFRQCSPLLSEIRMSQLLIQIINKEHRSVRTWKNLILSLIKWDNVQACKWFKSTATKHSDFPSFWGKHF